MAEIISMKGTASKDSCAPCTVGEKGPDYPYGIRVDLNNESLEKLGLKFDKFKSGATVKVVCEAVVTAKSENEYDGKLEKSLTLQITGMSKPSVISSDRMKTGADLLRSLRKNAL